MLKESSNVFRSSFRSVKYKEKFHVETKIKRQQRNRDVGLWCNTVDSVLNKIPKISIRNEYRLTQTLGTS